MCAALARSCLIESWRRRYLIKLSDQLVNSLNKIIGVKMTEVLFMDWYEWSKKLTFQRYIRLASIFLYSCYELTLYSPFSIQLANYANSVTYRLLHFTLLLKNKVSFHRSCVGIMGETCIRPIGTRLSRIIKFHGKSVSPRSFGFSAESQVSRTSVSARTWKKGHSLSRKR